MADLISPEYKRAHLEEMSNPPTPPPEEDKANTPPPEAPPAETSPEKSKKRCNVCIWVATLLKVVIVVSLLMAMTAIGLVLHKYVHTDESFFKKAFLCIYCSGIIAFSLFMLVAEFPPKWFSQLVPLLLHFPARGCGLLWMGVQVVNVLAQHTDILNTLIDLLCAISGWALVVVGLIYILAGFCMRYMLPKSYGGYGKSKSGDEEAASTLSRTNTNEPVGPPTVVILGKDSDPYEISQHTI